MSRSSKTSDFFRCVEKELKRISPTISLPMQKADTLNFIIEVLRMSIDVLLEEKTNLEQEYKKLNSGRSSRLSNEGYSDLSQAKLKIASTQKELSRYEDLLKEKEKKIDEKQADFELYMKSALVEKEILDNEKSIIEAKSKELELRIQSFQEKEFQMQKNFNDFISDKKKIDAEKAIIKQMKEKIEANYNESEKIREVNIMAHENIKKDIEKYEVENKVLEDRMALVALKQDYLEKMQYDIDRKKKILDEEKEKFSKDKENLLAFKQQISDERLALHEEMQELEKTKKSLDLQETHLKHQKTFEEKPETKDFDSLYDKLKAQIQVFNEEINIRESKLTEKQAKVLFDQKKVSESFFKIQKIEEKL